MTTRLRRGANVAMQPRPIPPRQIVCLTPLEEQELESLAEWLGPLIRYAYCQPEPRTHLRDYAELLPRGMVH